MNENGVRLVCFELCGEKFAFNTDYLVEIVQVRGTDIRPWVSPIPLVRGKWTYRNKTVAILDLREFFGLEDAGAVHVDLKLVEALPDQRAEEEQERGEVPVVEEVLKKTPSKTVLVVHIREQILGLLTDAVVQVVPLTEFYEYPVMISTLPKRYFEGLTLIGGELVIILAIEKCINEYELETLLSRISEETA
jgi:chemotaxis signal transduction protein